MELDPSEMLRLAALYRFVSETAMPDLAVQQRQWAEELERLAQQRAAKAKQDSGGPPTPRSGMQHGAPLDLPLLAARKSG